MLEFLRLMWVGTVEAMRLNPRAFDFVSATSGTGWVILAIAILGGASLLLGQSVILFLNRISPGRFALSLALNGVTFTLGLSIWALAIWATWRLLFPASLSFGSANGREELNAQGEAMLDQAVALVRSAHPDLPVVRTLSSGYASPALISAAHDAGMIVLGTTGSSALRLTGGMMQAESPLWTPAASMCSMMPATTAVWPSHRQSTSSSSAPSKNWSSRILGWPSTAAYPSLR